MIIKGSSRAGPSQLSRHLQRTDTNERVNILQLDSPTESLAEALRDWQFLSTGTRGDKGLYHANIDPDARYTMTPEQWIRSVDVLEKELGLEGQPRAVVMHEKHGREHIHVVWQRTDIDTMTLVSDSQNYRAHERASMALEKEFGHEHVPGKHEKRDREKQPEFPKQQINHAEWQQGERSGIDPREFKAEITALYEQSDNGAALKAALEEKGLVLAKGDRRDYVIVDEYAQVYSLARQINGVTAKDLREFMADIDRDMIPSVDQAKALQREHAKTIEPEKPQQEIPAESNKPSPEEIAKLEAALKLRHEDEGRRQRESQQAEVKQTSRILDGEIAEKLNALDSRQQAARERYDREHQVELRGFAGFVAAIKQWLNPEQAAEERRQREEAKTEFLRKQEGERERQFTRLNTVKGSDLVELTERHAQQQREHEARYKEELARYIREHENAKRLLAEIEEQRRREQELLAEKQRSRDGPTPTR
jgi:hypothetical protein